MSRGIKEYDIASSGADVMGADMLSDAASLAGRHIGITDGVKDRGLAMINMAHDRDHRGTGLPSHRRSPLPQG